MKKEKKWLKNITLILALIIWCIIIFIRKGRKERKNGNLRSK